MNKTYIAADMRLFDKAAAKELKIATSQYNQKIIDNINNIVSKDDYLIMVGIISCNDIDRTISILKKINAKKIILSRDQIYQDNKEKWLQVINLIYTVDGVSNIYKNDQIYNLVYIADKKYLSNYLKAKNIYIAAAESIINMNKTYSKPFFNISISNWDYMPLEIEEQIPQLIDDVELFDLMQKEINSENQ